MDGVRSIESLNCDKCSNGTDQSLCSSINDDCVWVPDNNNSQGSCMHKCSARTTKGECDQYHEWNRSTFSPVIYDFDGSDNQCQWFPYVNSMNSGVDSTEGQCRKKDSKCFDLYESSTCAGVSKEFINDEGEIESYCVPNGNLSELGDVYCGFYNTLDTSVCENGPYDPTNPCGDSCDVFVDPGYGSLDDSLSEVDKGRCISDGIYQYDPITGENMGLIKTNEECSEFENREGAMQDCTNYRGYGCLWEPYNKICLPRVNTDSINDALDSCKPIQGHLEGGYTLDLLEEQGINLSEYSERDDKIYPYRTSKYLCDVCHVRDNDLNKMKELSRAAANGDDEAANLLKYYMLRKYVDFGDVINDRSTNVSISPKNYCENEIDQGEGVTFSPCVWNGDTESDEINGSCISKCSTHTPTDEDNITSAAELYNVKEACINENWNGGENNIIFPRLFNGDEVTDDYFDERYCTWDGFECHNSIPCKFAQQTRCEDLGYDWYEGSALDVMDQSLDNEFGIPLDLSASYPVVRKGDGKPVEGDMAGICVYPNTSNGFVSEPGQYSVLPSYIGEQVIMLKYAEYGTGWWQDCSLRRKDKDLSENDVLGTENTDSFFLGENIILIPYRIDETNTPDSIKSKINAALQNYEYFVYNGRWVVYALDVINSIDRSYDSTINESQYDDQIPINLYRKNYGAYYYSNKNGTALGESISTRSLPSGDSSYVPFYRDEVERKRLNAIYDMRGAINILPVMNGHCALEIKRFHIDTSTGELRLEVGTPTTDIIDEGKFKFIEFIGTEILDPTGNIPTSGDLPNLDLTILSKFNYTDSTGENDSNSSLLPPNIIEGYGTLYENKFNMYLSSNTDNYDQIDISVGSEESGTTDPFSLYSSCKGLNNWAAHVEHTNDNKFSQTRIKFKGELNRCYGYSGAASDSVATGTGLNLLLDRNSGGSLESHKINGLPQPTYQSFDISTSDNSMLLLLKTYLNLTEDNNYQLDDINESVLWSISRNVPQFWGNLFYTRGTLLDSDYNSLYSVNGNFYTLDGFTTDYDDEDYVAFGEGGGHIVSNTSLFKPFVSDSVDTPIKWGNIMKYAGGNKRELMLSRNVLDSDIQNYRNYRNILYSSTLPNYDGVIDTYFNSEEIRKLTQMSMVDYNINALSDHLRLSYSGITSDAIKNSIKCNILTNGASLDGPCDGTISVDNFIGRFGSKHTGSDGYNRSANLTNYQNHVAQISTNPRYIGAYKNNPNRLTRSDCSNSLASNVDNDMKTQVGKGQGFDYDGDFTGPRYDLQLESDAFWGDIPSEPEVIEGTTVNNPMYYFWDTVTGVPNYNINSQGSLSPQYLWFREENHPSLLNSTYDNIANSSYFPQYGGIFEDGPNFETGPFTSADEGCLPRGNGDWYDTCINNGSWNEGECRNFGIGASGENDFGGGCAATQYLNLCRTYAITGSLLSPETPLPLNHVYPIYQFGDNGPVERNDRYLGIKEIDPTSSAVENQFLGNYSTDGGTTSVNFAIYNPGNLSLDTYSIKDAINSITNRIGLEADENTYGFETDINTLDRLQSFRNLKYDDNDDNNLRNWCMTSYSKNIVDTDKRNFINPTNPKNHEGILGEWTGITFSQVTTDTSGNRSGTPYEDHIFDYAVSDNNEFYNMNKDTFAVKYPDICEPWRLKVNRGDLSTYSDIIDWDNSDLSMIDNSILIEPATNSIVSGEYSSTNNINQYGSYLNDIDQYGNYLNDIYNDNAPYNLVYPTSIYEAKPSSKLIYVDIAPNNENIIRDSSIKMNKYFFQDQLVELEVNYSDSLTQDNSYNSLLNDYEDGMVDGTAYRSDITGYNLKPFWLHTGMSLQDSSGSIVPAGKNPDSDLDDFTKYVAYFRAVHYLLTNNILINNLDTENGVGPIVYRFNYEIEGNLILLLNQQDVFYEGSFSPSDNIPTRAPETTLIGSQIFGTGKNTGDLLMDISDSARDIITSGPLSSGPLSSGNLSSGTPLPESRFFYNVDNVLRLYQNDLTVERYNQCAEILRNKLYDCSNPLQWQSPTVDGCIECFDTDVSNLCPRYGEIISGDGTGGLRGEGVCGLLYDKYDNGDIWNYIEVSLEPPNYNQNLPDESPYNPDRLCNVNGLTDINYTTIDQAGDDIPSGITFFKPVRNNVSDIFKSGESEIGDSENRLYGCMREDLTLIDKDSLNISCNTSLPSSVERDKHVLINYIIKHTDELNTSQRTKLAIMSEEELINKALELGIPIQDINKYTKPTLRTTVRDNFIPGVNELTKELCDDDSIHCGFYEGWNDLTKYYYNINNVNDKNRFLNNKQWEFIGCGIDMNFSDGTSAEVICKDKYPGLCEQNIDKCDSPNTAVREAIMLDCPETCNVQYRNLEEFRNTQVGELSICTSRGRCKWSHDQDPSNLLPLCEENTSRQLGSIVNCGNYNDFDYGPQAGSCNLRTHPDTIDSEVCAEQRCTSMEGCVFTAGSDPYCRIPEYVDPDINTMDECPQGGRWVGTGTTGICIIPEELVYQDNLSDPNQDLREYCDLIGGNYSGAAVESCDYIPDIPYIGEDPCDHIVNLDDLTEDEQLLYFYPIESGPVYIQSIIPERMDGDDETVFPKYLKLTLTHNLLDEVTNYSNMDMREFPANKYIYVSNNTDRIDSLCSQYLLGKSKIMKISTNTDGKTEVVIGGPNKNYHVRMSNGQIDIGGDTSCQVMGIYDIDDYFVNNAAATNQENVSPVTLKKNACLNNPKGACNYEEASDMCVSCMLYEDQNSCFNEGSHCGWGSIKDMCSVIGSLEECNRMHMEGCVWDPAKQSCSLNQLTDTDGSPLVPKVGCVKCDNIEHSHICNSMKNCFWDSISPNTTPGKEGMGQCRACSSIEEGTGDGIDFGQDNDTPTTIIGKCDNFQLTKGQCQYRNEINETNGLFDSDTLDKVIEDRNHLFYDIFSFGITDTSDSTPENPCQQNPDSCKCMPTRLYPLFPDWIMYNLVYILMVLPILVYFIFFWFKVFVLPYRFKSNIDGSIVKAKIDFKIGGLFEGMFNTNNIKKSLFHDLAIKTTSETSSFRILIKLLFMLFTLPLTVLRILPNIVRLGIANKLASWNVLKDFLINLSIFGFTVGPFIYYPLIACIYIFGNYYTIKLGYTVFKMIFKLGIQPNPNYIEAVSEFTIDESEPAVWPQTLYREELDDMIKDPIPDSVIQERESRLPDILQGDIGEGGTTDVYEIAYGEIEPDDLDFLKYIRNIGSWWNRFINRIGDGFIFTFIIGAYVLYKYANSVNSIMDDYYISLSKGEGSLNIFGLVKTSFIYAILLGFVYAIMTPKETKDDEYDGAETKCYEPIDSPFVVNGEALHFPSLCFGPSNDENVNQCPYGCYYYGSGEDDPDYGKKCKDNRSIFSLKGILEPEPRLNIPFENYEQNEGRWEINGEQDAQYVCPPQSLYKYRWPIDEMCQHVGDKCMATRSTKYNTNFANESNNFCESKYVMGGYTPEACVGNWTYSTEGPRGPIVGLAEGVNCEVVPPDYSKDTNCPFPTPATENIFYETTGEELRGSVRLWDVLYDGITNSGAPQETSLQNQERYLIVNQNLGEDIFS